MNERSKPRITVSRASWLSYRAASAMLCFLLLLLLFPKQVLKQIDANKVLSVIMTIY